MRLENRIFYNKLIMSERVKNGNKTILQGCMNESWEKDANIGRRGGFFLWTLGSPYMMIFRLFWSREINWILIMKRNNMFLAIQLIASSSFIINCVN